MINKTERLYYDYTSSVPFEAAITELRPLENGGTQVLLDKTIFYPEGGGQPSDRGTINGVPLTDVLEKNGEILHLVSTEHAGPLRPGAAELVLDCRRRREFTQLHSGQHILSGTIMRKIGAQTVSMHLGDEICTIDVDTSIGELNDTILIDIEETVADVIEENRPVTVHLCPPEDISSFPLRKMPPQGEEVIRVVEIGGCDLTACCGTHVRTTAEIGMFRILGAEKYKGMARVSFLAGRRLLRDSRLLRQNAAVVSHALSVSVNDTGKGVLELLEKTAQTEKRLKVFEEKAVGEKADALILRAAACSGPALIVESYAGADINEVISIGKIAQKKTASAFVLASEPDLKFAALSSAKNFDLRALLKDALEAQGGKGGGGPSFFQGSFGTKEALGAFLRAVQK